MLIYITGATCGAGTVILLEHMRSSPIFSGVRVTRYLVLLEIRVITKLQNSEQSYKRKVKTLNYINRQNQSTGEKL